MNGITLQASLVIYTVHTYVQEHFCVAFVHTWQSDARIRDEGQSSRWRQCNTVRRSPMTLLRAVLGVSVRGVCGGGEREWRMRRLLTGLAVLELLLLVVVHHDVRLHGDELLLVKLFEVEQRELVKLLVAEQHLTPTPDNTR